MSRNTEERRLTTDDIFLYTNQGLDIWEREVPNMSFTSNISSPVRQGDNNPSFRVKVSRDSGLIIGVDYRTGEVFNGITLVQKLYNLTFSEAMDKISWDFGLKAKMEDKKYKKVLDKSTKIIKPPEPILYEYEGMKFEKRHHAYWNPGELTEDYLAHNNVFAAKKIAINKRVIEIPDDEMCFVYEPTDLSYGQLKILKIGHNVLPKDKWRTNVPNEYLWNFSKYDPENPVEKLWIAKSLKDELVLKLLGLHTCSTQSENWQILDMNMERIKQVSKQQVICYGSDPDGVYKCQMVQQKHETLYYNTPKVLLPGVNDPFSYVAFTSLRQLERHLQAKKLL